MLVYLLLGVWLERRAPGQLFPGLWLDAWLLLGIAAIFLRELRLAQIDAEERERATVTIVMPHVEEVARP